jgi:hypothetical protein
VAVDLAELRHPRRALHARDAALRRREPLHDGREHPLGRRDRRRHRRDALDAPARRGDAPPQRASPQLRARGRVLVRWRRVPRDRRHAGLPHGVAGREDRPTSKRLRRGRGRRSAARPGQGDRRRDGGDRLELAPHGGRRRARGGGGLSPGAAAPDEGDAAWRRPRLRRADRRAAVDLPHPRRTSPSTTPGRTRRRTTRGTPASGPP